MTKSFNLKSTFLILTVLIATFSLSFGQEYKIRMAFVGNSITQGVVDFGKSLPEESYVAEFEKLMKTVYGDTLEIYNAGVSGCTMMRSAEGPIWQQAKFKSALTFVPDICLIMLGTNDAKPYRWEKWGDEFLGDYLAMIDTFQYRNPNTKFIVCRPTPIWEGHPYGTEYSNLHNDNLLMAEVIPAVDTVVQKTGAILVDFHKPFVDSLQYFTDKLHPNEAGHEKMAKILFDKFIDDKILDDVESGLAYVSTFEQSKSPAQIGGTVELKWTTLFAESAKLDGVSVDTEGSKEVKVEEGKAYTLEVTGPRNSTSVKLFLKTYVPEISGLTITATSEDYAEGQPVVLDVDYKDQRNAIMAEDPSDITWSISRGEGILKNQTDTTIVFLPTATGTVTIEAVKGDYKAIKTLRVNNVMILDNQVIDRFEVYPNPVKNELTFKTPTSKNENGEVKILSLNGEVLIQKSFNSNSQNKLSINVESFESGIYLYQIKTSTFNEFGKFIKQ